MSYVNGICVIKRQSGPFRQSLRKKIILFSCAVSTCNLQENKNLLIVFTSFFYNNYGLAKVWK